MNKKLRIGIIGCGTIGGFALDAVREGKVENAEVAVVCGRSESSKGREKVRAYGIPWITNAEDLLNYNLDVIVETASHEAVEQYGPKFLRAGIDFIPVSLGALVDVGLLNTLIDSATEGNSFLHIPSGGIGALDALQAAIIAGVSKVTMTTRKAPVAWKKIPYVERMNLDLDNMKDETILYHGPARDCVKEFPQNINIAAALSLAGIGFDATNICIIADPNIKYNTHEILCEGEAGRIKVVFENVPVPENPKTTYMACLSVVAVLKRIRSSYRIGT